MFGDFVRSVQIYYQLPPILSVLEAIFYFMDLIVSKCKFK